ncbi:MAG: 2-oxoglutarate and iron-dependent oxygenase domain-containing protein [Ilumatobacter sp.]|uniref:isopenicillin N synthase family dioxygenase n=1 Tax=Ilumatobacter sp. TaxID=1967498 RepID=UPI00329A0BDF
MSVAIIDLDGFVGGGTRHRRSVAAEVDAACREIGFFSVTGHGVPDATVESAHRAALDFFDLSLEDRMSAAKVEPSAPYGYSPFSAEALNRSLGGEAAPDLKETYNVGPVGDPPRPTSDMIDADERDVWSPTPWPSAMPELRPILTAYHEAMAELAATLMDAFALALGLDDGGFAPFVARHGSALRLAHYPALDRPPEAGRLRAGAHSDYGTMTILRLDAEPGLQVETSPGQWVDVVAPDGALVVNLGDLMQRWSNDRWRSTMHRVVVPHGGHARRRLTMPFFHNADWDARIECITAEGERPRYEPITAGAHLMAKFRSTVV